MHNSSNNLIREIPSLKSILKASGQGMHIINNDYIIEFQNKLLKELFGDEVGQKCYSVYKKRSKPCEVCQMQLALQSNKQLTTEITMINKRCYTQRYAPFVDTNLEQKCLIFLQDITEEKTRQDGTIHTSQLTAYKALAEGVDRTTKEGERVATIINQLLALSLQNDHHDAPQSVIDSTTVPEEKKDSRQK